MEITFNHDGVKIYDSFKLTKEQGDKLDSVIMFETIVADRILEVHYEGDRENAPREILTKTGVLSRCLKYTNNDQEKIYLAYAFINKHNATIAVLAGYDAMSRVTDKDSVLQSSMIEAAREHFGDKFSEKELQEKMEEMLSSKTRPFKPMKKLVRQIDNSNYDYTLFKSMLDDEENGDSYIPEVIEDIVENVKGMNKD
jgi:hypothetical protein